MKKVHVYLLLFLLIIIFLQSVFFQQIIFGENTVPVSDNSGQMSRAHFLIHENPVNEDYELRRDSKNYDVYPPGYALLFATMQIIFQFNSFETWILFKLIFSIMFIFSGFTLGKKLQDSNLGILVALFLSLPVSIWFNYGETINPFIRIVSPNLNGTNTDVLFILLELLFIYLILFKKKSEQLQFIICFFLLSLAHGFSHISRYTTLFLSISTFFTLFYIYVRLKKGNIRNLYSMIGLMIIFLLSITTMYLTYFHFPLMTEDVEQEEVFSRLPSFFNEFWVGLLVILLAGIVIPICIILFIKIYRSSLDAQRVQNSDYTKIIRYYPVIYLVLVFGAAFLISLSPDLIGSGIPGPYYYGSIATERTFYGIGKYIIALFTLSMFYFGLSYFKAKINRDDNFIFFGIYLLGILLFIVSMMIQFQASRMNLYEYYRPILLAGGMFFFIQYFLERSNNVNHTRIKIISFIIMICLLNNTLVVYQNITSNPGITEIRYYENRIRSSDVMSNIDSSYNIIMRVNVLIEDQDVILTSPETQRVIGSIIPIRQIDEATIAHYMRSEELWAFFDAYNATYFVIVNDALKPSDEKSISAYQGPFSIEMFDSLYYLNLVYMNNLGERIYKYNRT